jgi:hypothetical protein
MWMSRLDTGRWGWGSLSTAAGFERDAPDQITVIAAEYES